MTDTGQDIEVPDEMSVQELDSLKNDTQGRFSWTFTQNPGYVECFWVNYYKTAAGNRSKDKNGAWKLLDHQKKVVRLSTP